MIKVFKTIGIFITIIISFQLYAQITNAKVTSYDGLNILWVGVSNPVSVLVTGENPDKLRVTIDHGTIEGGFGRCRVIVNQTKDAIIEVSEEMTDGQLHLIDRVSFREKNIPNPITCVGNYCKPHLNLTKQDLLTDPEVKVSSNLPFKLGYEVVSYTCSMVVKGVSTNFEVIGSRFTDEIIEGVKILKKGGIINIDEIKAKTHDGRITFLFPIQIKLVN